MTKPLAAPSRIVLALALAIGSSALAGGPIGQPPPALAGSVVCISEFLDESNIGFSVGIECDLPTPPDYRLQLTLVHPDGYRQVLYNQKPTAFSPTAPWVYLRNHYPVCSGTFKLEHRDYVSGTLNIAHDEYTSVPWYWIDPCFNDTGASAFRPDIYWALSYPRRYEGITGGCSSTSFCPRGAVTRGQMAAFLNRALELPATSIDFFSDDESDIFEGDINRLAAAGITGGCDAARFCPNAVVTREQMAAFLDRALGLTATAQDFFADDESSIFEASINRLAAAGITGGCTATNFCGKSAVLREQMVAFLHRALT